MSSQLPELTFPLSPIEKQVRMHAILSTTGFLILLPIGTLIPRYSRTFTSRWFWPHAGFQLVIAGPIIFAGWYYGYKSCSDLGYRHTFDPHQKMGLALLVLYVFQLLLGMFIHWIKVPTLGKRKRPLQNYFHGFLGLAILVLAASQVHYGLYEEWDEALGGLHHVPKAAKNAWLALIIVFWILYLAGLSLLPRQFHQEWKTRGNRTSDERSSDRGGRA